MRGEWCYFKSYLDGTTCDKIIRDALSVPSQDAVVGQGTGLAVSKDIRRSKVRFISATDPKFQYLFDILWKTAIQANKDFFDIHITKLDFIQFAEYDSSYLGEYKEHHDVFWMNNDAHFHRKLTCVIQLSDPSTYEGGNLELTETYPLDIQARERGSLIYFPSMFRHKATAVTKGTRYSIAAWFEGPKWR